MYSITNPELNGIEEHAQELARVGLRNWFQGFRMVFHPTMVSLLVVALWHFVARERQMSQAAAEPIINAVVGVIAMFHIFLITMLMSHEMGDTRRLMDALPGEGFAGDKRQFMLIIRDRIPAPMKFVVLTTASITQGWVMSLHYVSYWSGCAAVFTVAYVLTIAWEIVADYDDPFGGVWVVKNTPPDWAREAQEYIRPRWSDRIYDRIYALTLGLAG